MNKPQQPSAAKKNQNQCLKTPAWHWDKLQISANRRTWSKRPGWEPLSEILNADHLARGPSRGVQRSCSPNPLPLFNSKASWRFSKSCSLIHLLLLWREWLRCFKDQFFSANVWSTLQFTAYRACSHFSPHPLSFSSLVNLGRELQVILIGT